MKPPSEWAKERAREAHSAARHDYVTGERYFADCMIDANAAALDLARHEALEHAAREVERLMLVIGDNHDQRLTRAAEAVRKMKEMKP